MPTTQIRRLRFLMLQVLLGMDAFVAGGLVALLAVNRMLQGLVDSYAPRSMDDASTILDVMDKLLADSAAGGGILLLLAPLTLVAVAWHRVRSRSIRYGLTALSAMVVVLALAAVGQWLWGPIVGAIPPVPPTTPTPTPFG